MMAAAKPHARWLPPLALALLTGLAYVNAAPKALVHDDNTALAQNPRFGGVSRIPQLFRESVWEGVAGNRRLYRPLAMATLSADRTIYRGDPRGYHVTSIVLHVATTLVLFGLLSALGAGRLGAFLAALIFGVHPIHTEAVDVAFNRSEVLATLGSVGALWWLWHWLERARLAAWGGVAVLYFLALLCRESAATLPLLAALCVVLLRPAASLRESFGKLTPLLVLAIPLGLYLAARGWVLGEAGGGVAQSLWAQGIGGSHAPGQRLALVAATLRDYWRMLVWPWPLRASYEDYELHGVGFALALHAALIGAALATRRRFPALTLGIAFFYVALLPSTRLFADPALLAERFVYLPSAGMAIPLAFGFAALAGRHGPRTAAAVGLSLVALLAPLTLQRNQAWRSRQALWEAEARASQNDWRVLLNLSQVRIAQGRFAEALALCDRGLTVAPSKTGFHTNRGAALISLGRFAEAEASFTRAVADGGDPSARANLARLYAASGRLSLAEKSYREAMASEPNEAVRRALEGELLLQCRSDLVGARAAYQAALSLSPGLPAARQGLKLVESRERSTPPPTPPVKP